MLSVNAVFILYLLCFALKYNKTGSNEWFQNEAHSCLSWVTFIMFFLADALIIVHNRVWVSPVKLSVFGFFRHVVVGPLTICTAFINKLTANNAF